MIAEATDCPQVSILIPTYNRSTYLREALASVFAQSLIDFEVIVTDNCSTDDTATVVAAWQHDSRLRYLRNEMNLGAVGNYNQALQAARGEFIYFFSDDDVMIDPRNLALKADILARIPTVGLVFSGLNTIDSDGKIIGGNWSATIPAWASLTEKALLPRAAAYQALYNGPNFIMMSTVMIRRRIAQENHIVFNNQMHYLVDLAMWLQISLFADFYYLDQPLIHYRRHNTSETNFLNQENVFTELILLKVALSSLFPKIAGPLDIKKILSSTRYQVQMTTGIVAMLKKHSLNLTAKLFRLARLGTSS